MITKGDAQLFLRRHLIAFAMLALLGAAAGFYYYRVPGDPPGFYIDESSISYNAYTISQTARDEYGNKFPLFFRAFGEYKNPTFIYLLAAVFRVTGPSISAARLLTATLGVTCGLLLGLLAWRMTGEPIVAGIVAISTLLTPWLYESSRLVFEVAIYPSLLVLFLLALQRASRKEKWQATDILVLAATLGLLTYSYSIGRLLAPLLAAGLAFFITRRRWQGVIKTWLAYLLMLVPLFVFYRLHPGALTDRFRLLTYVTPESTIADDIRQFVWHYVGNINPWRWLSTGENNVRDHLPGHGSLLAVTIFLGIAGLFLVWHYYRRDAWWWFILYGLIVSVVPASLTRNEFPQLRLIAFPVFSLVLTVPTIRWLLADGAEVQNTFVSRRAIKRALLSSAVLLIAIQGAYFQSDFHQRAAALWYVFDARFPRKVLSAALAANSKPIYLVDEPGKSGYIQAYWYGVLLGLDTAQLVRLPTGTSPPPGAVVISTAEECDNCRLLARSINYIVYAVPPYKVSVPAMDLPANWSRALITAEDVPAILKTGQTTALNVTVKNLSTATWSLIGESDAGDAVVLRSRWLGMDGVLLEDLYGKGRFPYDLEPGDTAGLSLKVTAPKNPGEYVLELDVVQEGLPGPSESGSQPSRFSIKVNQ
jgi:4-amino-4-deoxy-L-arabinose transferase-like glycosyltransferase